MGVPKLFYSGATKVAPLFCSSPGKLDLDLERSRFLIMISLPNFCTGTKDGKGIMKNNSPDANPALTKAEVQISEPSNPSRSHWMPTESYTMQQAIALTGLSEHTLRYYERIGLITPVQRQESSGHRRYSSDDLVRLEALACLRAIGMPIDQMHRYFELRSAGRNSADAAELQVLLSEHLGELHRRVAQLQAHIEYVELKIDYWRAVEAHDEQTAINIACEVVELSHSTLLPPAPSQQSQQAPQ